MEFNDIRMIDQLHCGNFPLNLFNHLMTKNMIAIENLDGNALTSVDILSELNLSEITFAQSLAQFVLPNPRPGLHGRTTASCVRLSQHRISQ